MLECCIISFAKQALFCLLFLTLPQICAPVADVATSPTGANDLSGVIFVKMKPWDLERKTRELIVAKEQMAFASIPLQVLSTEEQEAREGLVLQERKDSKELWGQCVISKEAQPPEKVVNKGLKKKLKRKPKLGSTGVESLVNSLVSRGILKWMKQGKTKKLYVLPPNNASEVWGKIWRDKEIKDFLSLANDKGLCAANGLTSCVSVMVAMRNLSKIISAGEKLSLDPGDKEQLAAAYLLYYGFMRELDIMWAQTHALASFNLDEPSSSLTALELKGLLGALVDLGVKICCDRASDLAFSSGFDGFKSNSHLKGIIANYADFGVVASKEAFTDFLLDVINVGFRFKVAPRNSIDSFSEEHAFKAAFFLIVRRLDRSFGFEESLPMKKFIEELVSNFFGWWTLLSYFLAGKIVAQQSKGYAGVFVTKAGERFDAECLKGVASRWVLLIKAINLVRAELSCNKAATNMFSEEVSLQEALPEEKPCPVLEVNVRVGAFVEWLSSNEPGRTKVEACSKENQERLKIRRLVCGMQKMRCRR